MTAVVTEVLVEDCSRLHLSRGTTAEKLLSPNLCNLLNN